MAVLTKCVGSWQVVNGKLTWVCDTTATPKPGPDPIIEGSAGGFGFMPVPELLRLLHAGSARSAEQSRTLARSCRERAEGLRKTVQAVASKGLDAKGAAEVSGTFQVDHFVLTIGGDGKQREPRHVSNAAEAAAVAQVLAQQVMELETCATALEGAAWMAEVLRTQHRD